MKKSKKVAGIATTIIFTVPQLPISVSAYHLISFKDCLTEAYCPEKHHRESHPHDIEPQYDTSIVGYTTTIEVSSSGGDFEALPATGNYDAILEDLSEPFYQFPDFQIGDLPAAPVREVYDKVKKTTARSPETLLSHRPYPEVNQRSLRPNNIKPFAKRKFLPQKRG